MEKPQIEQLTTDQNGLTVRVGDSIRVLHFEDAFVQDLPSEEVARVKSMLGEIFCVYEIDGWKRAWVEKWWHEGTKQGISHSLALDPAEMELVKKDV